MRIQTHTGFLKNTSTYCSPPMHLATRRVGHLASVISIPADVRMRVWVVERSGLDATERARTATSPSARSARLSHAFYDMGEMPRLLYLHRQLSSSYGGQLVSCFLLACTVLCFAELNDTCSVCSVLVYCRPPLETDDACKTNERTDSWLFLAKT